MRSFQPFLRHCAHQLVTSRRGYKVIGIETSCDDTAVAIVGSDRKVFSSVRYTNRSDQQLKGGICPGSVAVQHLEKLPSLIQQCITESGCSFDAIDAVAVTTKPGLVIALKEGIKMGIQLAKTHNKPLIPVHHMRAHALSGFLCSESLNFPFLTLLISGGHSLIVLVRSVEDFVILGKSLSGSAGECLDKIARELNIQNIPGYENMHAGAALELLARKASSEGYLRYQVNLPSIPGADMNFSQLKSSFLNLAKRSMCKDDFSIEDFCSSAQHYVARHIISRLNGVLDFLKYKHQLEDINHLVVSGGVASNAYINNGIKKVCSYYNIDHIAVPPHLCTDNAEMIAWTGILMMNAKSAEIYSNSTIPDSIYAHARFDIGTDERDTVPRKIFNKLSGHTLHGDMPIKLFNSEMFRKNKDL